MQVYLQPLKFVTLHYGFVILLGLVSYAIGYRLTRRLNYDSFLEEVSMCTGLGLGAISFLIFLLGLVGLLYPSVVFLTIAVCVAASYSAFPRLIRAIKLRLSRTKLLLGGAIVLLATPLLALPLYPPTAFDSTMYFLTSAKIYARSHQIVFTPYLRLPALTQFNEMLFTLALLLYDDIAAHLIQLLMLLVVTLTVIAFGRKCFSRAAGWWSAALLLANPMVLFAGAVAYVDISLVLFGTLAAYAFWNWFHSRERGWLLVSGAFCGFAAGSKYPGLFFPLVFGLVAVYLAIRERKYSLPFRFAALAAAIGSPWYIRNFYYTRNPVFPFFPRIFGYTFWSSEDVQGFVLAHRRIGVGRSLRALLTLPWHLAYNQEIFNGSGTLTQLYLFALPIVVFFSVKDVRIRKVFGLAIIFTLFWFFSAQELRYLMPALPMMSIAAAASLDRLFGALPSAHKWSHHWIVVAVISSALVYGGWKFPVVARHWWGPVPLTPNERENYLTLVLPSYPAYKLLNSLKGNNYKVYALYDVNVAYYADGQFMGDVVGPGRYGRVVKNLSDGHALYVDLRSLGADFLLVNSRGWSVRLPQDTFFKEHFKLIYSQESIEVFALDEGNTNPGSSQDAR